MDGYRIKQIGPDFVVSSGDLKCQTEKDAQTIIAAALDLLENPDEWWNVLRQRLAASEAARQSSSAGGDLAVFGHQFRHRYAKRVGLGGWAVRGCRS